MANGAEHLLLDSKMPFTAGHLRTRDPWAWALSSSQWTTGGVGMISRLRLVDLMTTGLCFEQDQDLSHEPTCHRMYMYKACTSNNFFLVVEFLSPLALALLC